MKSKAILLTFFCAASVQAVTFTPIAHLTTMGGQYFTNSTDSTGANIDASFVPVIGFSPSLYLIPIYLGSYRETQSVYNFLGENTLIQKQLDQTLVLRGAWAMNSSWRLKPRIGYTKEWTQQSTDETLWGGLFNFRRGFGGISAEKVLGNGSLEIGYEYGGVKYPNYQALIADPRLTSTGITQNAGTRVLNFRSHETSLIYQLASDNHWNASAHFTWIRENFVDQKVITIDDFGFEAFLDDQRRDDIYNLALQQGWRLSRHWTVNMGETVQYYTSTQNAFDGTQAASTPYTPHYYNFVDLQLMPSVTLYLDDNRWDVTVGGTFGYREYSHRRAQDGAGAYMDELIYSINRGANITVRYDLGRHFKERWLKRLHVVMNGSFLRYGSNTRYEVNYPYNYSVYNYLGGLSWDF